MLAALLSGLHQIGELEGLIVKFPGTLAPEAGSVSVITDARGISYTIRLEQETPNRVRLTVTRA